MVQGQSVMVRVVESVTVQVLPAWVILVADGQKVVMAVTTVVVQLSGMVDVDTVATLEEVQSAQVPAEVVLVTTAGVVVVVALVVVVAAAVVVVEIVQSAHDEEAATPAEAVEARAATAATEAATFILIV